MTTMQKIDGWNGSVIAGDPSAGDLVRVTTDGGHVSEYRYTPPPAPVTRSWRTRDEVKAAMKAVDATKYVVAMTDPRLTYFLTRLAMVDQFTKTGAELVEGLDTLVALGLWSSANKQAFLDAWTDG